MKPLAAAQGVWRRVLPLPIRRLAAPLLTSATQAYAMSGPRPGTIIAPPGAPIRVVGMFNGASGIAASARLAVRAFEAIGVPVERVEAGASGLDFSRGLARRAEPATWIFHLNPPELLAALASLGPSRVAGPRYGYWAWELPRAPKAWLRQARVLDEVWAPSHYTADALAGAAAPVRVVPHPLFIEDYAKVAPAPRRAAFQGVSVFDFKSSLARKNPHGAIAAWARAFGDALACELTLKTQNGALFPASLAELRAAAPANVRLIDEVWPYAEVQSLIAGADVLVSLHRAEGFGLTPAEAMALGTPVLATGWSGVLDFMDEDSALLVPSQLTPVADPQGVYREQTWAEPDIGAAANLLVRIRSDGRLRRRLAQAGRARVARQLSPQAWFETLPAQVQDAARAAART